MEYFSERQLKIINRPTPKEFIEEKEERGKKVRYVAGHYVKKTLNELFGYNWQEHILRTDYFPDKGCVVSLVRLTAMTDTGKQVLKEQFGGSYVDGNIPYAYKAAATDGLKKCASEIGLFSDVYTDEKPSENASPLDDPLVIIASLRQDCIGLEIEFTKTDANFFTKTVSKRDKGNYEKCIQKLKTYIAKTKKQ